MQPCCNHHLTVCGLFVFAGSSVVFVVGFGHLLDMSPKQAPKARISVDSTGRVRAHPVGKPSKSWSADDAAAWDLAVAHLTQYGQTAGMPIPGPSAPAVAGSAASAGARVPPAADLPVEPFTALAESEARPLVESGADDASGERVRALAFLVPAATACEDPRSADLVAIAGSIRAPGSFAGLLSVVAFMAYSTLSCNLFMCGALMNPLDWMPASLCRQIKRNQVDGPPLAFAMCRVRSIGGSLQVFLPGGLDELLHCNHFVPIVPIACSPASECHDPCGGHLCAASGLCMSPITEALRPHGFMPWAVAADGDCLWHSILWVCGRSSTGHNGFENRIRLKASVADFLFERRNDPAWQEAVVWLGEQGVADRPTPVLAASKSARAGVTDVVLVDGDGDVDVDAALAGFGCHAVGDVEDDEFSDVDIDNDIIAAIMTAARLPATDRATAARIAGRLQPAERAAVFDAAGRSVAAVRSYSTALCHERRMFLQSKCSRVCVDSANTHRNSTVWSH